MVLVVGILVLLAIIATSYLTRTHAGRVTAISQQRAALRDDNARAIAEFLAGEVSGALFVRPVDPADPLNSNAPRLTQLRNPLRYGYDPTDERDNVTGLLVVVGDGIPDFPYNFAPHQVVPFSNWPDPNPADPSTFGWPRNPGGTVGQNLLMLVGVGEGNPIGGPGFGDTRWLADLEPLRITLPGPDAIPGTLDDVPVFSHWRHLTNIARPDNGWRIVPNIADVYLDLDNDGYFETPNVVWDLGIPVEQWLALRPFFVDPFTGASLYNASYFEQQWANWLDLTAPGYQGSYFNSAPADNAIPANFYNLGDLDGDGIRHNLFFGGVPQENPESEFIRGTARWSVSRVLADADGDGFTDSFWFLAPATVERGIRQVVAVRIVDNSAMVNLGTATGFVRRDPVPVVPPAAPTRTEGLTPADVALVGQLLPYPSLAPLPGPENHWNVGFYDNPHHWYDLTDDPLPNEDRVRYDDGAVGGVEPADLWARHLQEVGLYSFVSLNIADPDFLKPNQAWRQEYWRRAGLSPLAPDPASPFTPFGLPEEIELRMFHGNNYPWIYSRLEHTTQARSDAAYGFLRGSPGRAESTEYRLQLSNRDLLGDSRHRLTVYNGARNDLMPPWLWPVLYFPYVDIDGDGTTGDVDDMRQFMALNLKCDLRRPEYDRDVDGDGFAGEFISVFPASPYDDDINDDGFFAGGGIDERDHHALIRRRLEAALVESVHDVSYFDTAPGDSLGLEMTQRMAASMTANIAAYRDTNDEPLTLDWAIEWQAPMNADNLRYVGLEAQPFLVEAFVAHVYGDGATAERMHVGLGNAELINVGDNVICSTSPQSTIVAVQIANPFDRPVSLAGFVLDVFEQSLDFELAGLIQPLAPGQARTFYSIEDASPVDFTEWKALLGIIDGPDVVNVTAAGVWSNNRSPVYNSADPDHAVELHRKINDAFGTPVPVLIDRIDIKPGQPDEPAGINKLGESFLGMPQYTGSCTEPLNNEPWFDVKNIGSDTHLVQMVPGSRAWEVDFSAPSGIQADEMNPRYVFASRDVDPSVRQYTNVVDLSADPARLPEFDSRFKDVPSVSDRLHFSMQMLQKDADFEQVGELLNVWLFGHELRFNGPGPGGTYTETASTFSEFLWDEIENQSVSSASRSGVNRLRLEPTDTAAGATISMISPIIGEVEALPTDPLYLLDPMHGVPGLPAGARVLDAFVCDRGGLEPGDADDDGVPNTFNDEFVARLGLAHGFSGKATPGQINANTAPPEVLSALPHWARLVHETGMDEMGVTPLARPTPRVRLAEATVQYRERLGSSLATSIEPDYRDRDALLDDDGLHPERGLASAGELMLLTEQPTAAPVGHLDPAQYQQSWRIDMAGDDPFDFQAIAPSIESARASTDVVGGYDPVTLSFGPDKVAADVEEDNLLYLGLSNLVTTRSDTFTVYFKVRSFRQDPTTGRWDATDPEMILDESRYVMLVDRSEVNHPSQKPRILYLEKLPK
jgi:hypothetical protein